MNLEEIQAAIGGPTHVPSQPEGGSDVQPLPGHGASGPGTQPAPENVTAAQGAGSTSGGLTPGAQQVNGSIHIGGVNRPDSSQGPRQLSVVPGLGALTAGGNFGANRPPGGAMPGGEPVGRPDHALGRDQSTGAGLNPALGRMPKTPPWQVRP